MKLGRSHRASLRATRGRVVARILIKKVGPRSESLRVRLPGPISSAPHRSLVQRWLIHGITLLALLLPAALSAVDHHSAERIPTHEHHLANVETSPFIAALRTSRPESRHGHAFEATHAHDDNAARVEPSHTSSIGTPFLTPASSVAPDFSPLVLFLAAALLFQRCRSFGRSLPGPVLQQLARGPSAPPPRPFAAA